MKRSLLMAATVAALLLLSACEKDGKWFGRTASEAGAPALSRTTVLANLANPWDIAFAPDRAMLFTEKCRGLSVLRDGNITWLFGISGAALVAPDFFCQGQSGMHGVAVDPDFGAGNRFVYVFMASNLSTSPRTNRVVRLRLSEDYSAVSDRTDIITDIPFKDAGNAVGGPGAHSGGRIRFGPDRLLYVTTGDNHNPSLPQDLRRLGGKVLRVDRNGAAAPANRTPAGGDPRIYTLGHRNVQGIAFRPSTGQAFSAEHGPNHSDEVTALVAGGNAGWDPQNRPGLNCPDNYCGYAGSSSTMPMTDTARFPDAMRPSWTNDGASQGMGPSEFLTGPQWKIWDGRLAVGFMRGQRVELLELDPKGLAVRNVVMPLPSVRYRSLVQGPDGSLYVATDGGEIWQVTPQ